MKNILFVLIVCVFVSCNNSSNPTNSNNWKSIELTDDWGDKTGKTIQRYTTTAQRYTATDEVGSEYTIQIDCYTNRTEIKILDSSFIGFGPSGEIKAKYNNEVMEFLVFHPDGNDNKMYFDGVPKNTHMDVRAKQSGFSAQQWNSILKSDNPGLTDLIKNSEDGIITVMMDKRDFENSSSGINKYKFTIKTLGENFNKQKSSSETIIKNNNNYNSNSGDAPSGDAPSGDAPSKEH
tara:strand:+ start:61 stop:765 length:705 start_codon:yes stop_codon:yes gene_type:complete